MRRYFTRDAGEQDILKHTRAQYFSSPIEVFSTLVLAAIEENKGHCTNLQYILSLDSVI